MIVDLISRSSVDTLSLNGKGERAKKKKKKKSNKSLTRRKTVRDFL